MEEIVLAVVKSLADSPAMLLLAVILIGVGWLLNKVSTKMLDLLTNQLSKVVEEISSVSGEVSKLRVSLETHIQLTSMQFDELKTRIAKLEDRG